MYKKLADIPHVSIVGNFEERNRSGIMYINFPQEWNLTNDILKKILSIIDENRFSLKTIEICEMRLKKTTQCAIIKVQKNKRKASGWYHPLSGMLFKSMLGDKGIR